MDIWLFDQLVPHFSEFLFCVTAPLTSPVHPFQSDPEGMIVEVLHFLYRSTDTVVVIGSSQFSIKRRHEYRELDVSVFFYPFLQVGFELLLLFLTDEMSNCILACLRFAVYMREAKKIKIGRASCRERV